MFLNKLLKKDPMTLNPKDFKDQIIQMIKQKSDSISPEEAAKMVMEIDNELYQFEGVVARRFGEGIHPKHKHIKYHEFFTKNINRNDNILDIGSSNGELASDIAKKANPGMVYGIEIEEWHVNEAKKLNIPNLKISLGDATKEEDLPDTKIDIITLSNVLEHIENRPELLKKLVNKYNPKKVLIRVPSFQRDWRVPFKKELGVDYRLDDTHFIEFTNDTFSEEMSRAGLNIKSLENVWGEIWAILEPKK